MNTPRFLSAATLFGVVTLAAVTLAPHVARAQTTATTAVTDPVGYLTTALPANSDTYVSIPFTRPAEFTGAIASVATTGTAPNTVGTITLAGTPGFTAGAFAPLATAEPSPSTGHKTYYAIIGPKNVALTPTLSVTSGSPTVTVSAALPADFAVGDTVTVAGYTFTVAAISGTTVTLDRNYPGTTASSQAATYNHSPSEGRFYTVSTNDAGSLTVNLNGDSLSTVTAGTQVSVMPYWTLGTAFPASDEGKSYFSSSTTFNRATELLFPNLQGVGINLVSSGTYFYYSNAWRKFGDPIDGTNVNTANDAIVYPDSYLTYRNNTGNAAVLVPVGQVVTRRLTVTLNTQTNSKQDNLVSVTRPVALTLKESGLFESGAFVGSTSTFNHADELLVYDNAVALKRKTPAATYFYYGGGWRKVGTPVTDPAFDNQQVLLPGTGYIIRKNAAPTTSFWQNAATYLN